QLLRLAWRGDRVAGDEISGLFPALHSSLAAFRWDPARADYLEAYCCRCLHDGISSSLLDSSRDSEKCFRDGDIQPRVDGPGHVGFRRCSPVQRQISSSLDGIAPQKN